MSDSIHRKKQPEVVRECLLEAAKALTIEQGWGNFSLDAVAKKAGVSKGGLIHHFPNKNALLDALYDEMLGFLERFIKDRMDSDPDPEGRFVRAYLGISLLDDDDPRKQLMLAACLTGTPCDDVTHRKWHDWMDSNMQESRRYVRDMIVKYAADGLWFDYMHGNQIPRNMRQAIVDRLVEITRRREDPLDLDDSRKMI